MRVLVSDRVGQVRVVAEDAACGSDDHYDPGRSFHATSSTKQTSASAKAAVRIAVVNTGV